MPTAQQYLTETLRGAAADRIEQTSLRQTAREIGLSPTGLLKFVEGSRPYRGTARKLEAWYARRAARDGGGHSPETVAAAVRVLATVMSREDRAGFVDEVLGRISGSLPADQRWRAEFGEYAEYMRA